MSIAYKCDRCGEFFEDYPHIFCIDIFNRGSGGIDSLTSIDLCMQCEAELNYFIKHSPKDNCENEG